MRRLRTHMRKSQFSLWLMAVAVLMVAAYASVPARAQSYGASHLRSDKYRKSSLDTVSWERQRRKVHRRSDSSRASPAISAKSKRGKSARGVSKKTVRTATVSVEDFPLPRPRPPFWPEPPFFAEAAGADFDSGTVSRELRDFE